MTTKNWHGRCGPLLNSHSGSANGTMLRITIRPHWHCCASIRRASCCCMNLSSPAEISGNCSRRRQWPMPKPSSFGQKKPIMPTQGQPHLLMGSIVELREEMKCYVFFSDKDVFSGMALPQEPSITQSKEAAPESAQPMQTDSPVKEAIAEVTKEPTKKEQPPNQFPGWKEVIHPSRPVVATRQIHPISQGPKQRPCSWSSGERMVRQQWPNESKVQIIKSEPLSPTIELEISGE